MKRSYNLFQYSTCKGLIPSLTRTISSLIAISACCCLPSLSSPCFPSDPFEGNPLNLCPQGYAFSFSDSFRTGPQKSKSYYGKPTSPGLPGKILYSTDGYYTGIQIKNGVTRIDSTVETKSYSTNGDMIIE